MQRDTKYLVQAQVDARDFATIIKHLRSKGYHWQARNVAEVVRTVITAYAEAIQENHKDVCETYEEAWELIAEISNKHLGNL